VPLIVVAPGCNHDSVSARVVEMLDFYPTFADFCGLPKPPQGEGKSFTPLLKDPHQPWDKVAFTVERRPKVLGRSVRNERYRYTEWDEGKQGTELYDYEIDPTEDRNLATDSKHQQVIADMKRQLREGWKSAR